MRPFTFAASGGHFESGAVTTAQEVGEVRCGKGQLTVDVSHGDQDPLNTSSNVLATLYSIDDPAARNALKCALPHAIFAPSASRKSSMKRLLFVSTTK